MRIRFTILLLFVAGILPAQQTENLFQGTWLGKLTQDQPPPFDSYRFRLHIAQNGNLLTGVTHISVPDSLHLYAEMEFKGFASEDLMTFRETRETRSYHLKGKSWCIKKGSLRLTENGGLYRLEGTWSGSTGTNPCLPGKIVLEKLNPNPPTNLPAPQPDEESAAVEEEEEEYRSYGALDGRPISRQRDVRVKRRTLTLYVWDPDKVDGDIVSLSFNGQWLLRNYPIKREKHAIEVVLDENADNRLILYAENEGRLPPNTAALTFYDGERKRNLSLVSTKKTCGAIKFIFKP